MTKILLVEDDNNLREIYQARLQAEGYTIVSARDGEEALVVAKAEKPDLVISDVMMPKISGFEMLDIMRNTDGLKDVKVIMLTALGQSDDQQRADKLGADRYLVKSQVTLEDIIKTAHDLLAGEETAPPPAGSTTPDQPKETPAPTPSPGPAPEIKVEAVQPAPDEKAEKSQAAINSANDHKLMADAVDTLVADAEKKDKPKTDTKFDEDKPAGETKLKLSDDDDSTDKPVDKPADKPQKNTDKSDSEDDEEESGSGSVHIAHKKIIKPIGGEPKKDLDALLAIEEAKEATEAAGSGPAETANANESTGSSSEPGSVAAEEDAVDAKIEDFVAGATTDPTTPDKASGSPASDSPPAPKPADKPQENSGEASSDGTPITVKKDQSGPPAAPADDPKHTSDPNSIAL